MDGDGYVRVNDQTIPLRSGYIYFIPANTLYSCWCDTFIKKLYVEVSAEIVPGYDIFSSMACVKSIYYPVEDIIKLVQINEIHNPKNLLYFKGEVTRVLSEFVDETYQFPDMDILKFRGILTDIEQNLSCSLKVRDIAQKHGWNSTVLSRNFKKVFHCPLKRYVEKLLIIKIKQDLILTNKCIKEIAADYKFCDQYYFSYFFKKYESVSPSKYRIEHNIYSR